VYRAERVPQPSFSEELPIHEKRQEITDALNAHQVVIVCGETGSGKTTQLPKMCLAMARGVAGMIGHTQPRRIVARSVATRIAQELGEDLGGSVGYKVRFSDRMGPNTFVKLMTDGILLAETQGDRLLDQYDTIIIDEAHERSLNIDFLLGYLKQLLPRRRDLKIIITSATIDPERFARHFGGAPVIEVSGRTYPVEVRYRPVTGGDSAGWDTDLQKGILKAVDELPAAVGEDVLVFLSGEREIRETAVALRKHHSASTEVLPLYARLSAAQQDRVFQSHAKRRIVLATNVAETSLTVPGIRYVIDPGYARMSRYSHRAKVQRLPVEKVSQASAQQRKGRCGRLGPGICIRLYSEDEFLARPEFTEPEIQRTNLASVILQMKALGLGDVAKFPFLESPDSQLISDGFKLLAELGAVDQNRELTSIGRQLARLPVDPRIARMLAASHEEGSLAEVLVIASALSIQDPRERPVDYQKAADAQHRQFQDRESDFLSLLNLWQFFEEQRQVLSQNKLRRLCQNTFLSYLRMREWRDVHRELTTLVRQMGFERNRQPAGYKAVHKALLAGLLGNIAVQGEGNEYQGAHGVGLFLFPGSGLFSKSPKWIMAAEFLETSRLYAHTVARIEPAWVEDLAHHLVRRSYVEPHWNQHDGQVKAYEKVSLYGLMLHTGRRIHYGPMNPVEARSLFIQGALVEEKYESKAAFWRHNRRLIDDVRKLEEKSRRRDVLISDEGLFSFYSERLPADVYSQRRLERWLKKNEHNRELVLSRDMLMRHAAEGVTEKQFPDGLLMNGTRFKLHYHFEPNHPADGVTLTVPLATLNQVDAARCEWLVPGLLLEKVTALMRSLPKSLRRKFVPVAKYSNEFILLREPGEESLGAALAAYLEESTDVQVRSSMFSADALPDHLLMNFCVVDNDGQDIAMGRRLEELRESLGAKARETFATGLGHEIEREGITRWIFGDVPESVSFERDGVHLTGYPTIEDCGASVALRVVDSEERARRMMVEGVRRLFMLELAQPMSYLRRNLPGIQKMSLCYASVGSAEELKDDLLLAVTSGAFIGEAPPVRREIEFHERKQQAAQELVPAANELCALVEKILAEYREVASILAQLQRNANSATATDVQEQIRALIFKRFVSQTPRQWLVHFPRYLKAVRLRFEKLEHNPAKDAQRAREIKPLWQRYLEKRAANSEKGLIDSALDHYRWMLEEWRVSLFAQELKTALPVSAKRLQKQWEKVV